MFAFDFCETACRRGLQGTAKERVWDMNKDKELELKVQMFCAAIRGSDISHFFYMSRFAENVNVAFKVLKEGSDES